MIRTSAHPRSRASAALRAAALRAAAVLAAAASFCACETERVVYMPHDPLKRATGGPLPTEGQMPDGTRIIYIDGTMEDWRRARDAGQGGAGDAGSRAGAAPAPAPEIRVERAGGPPVLRNMQVQDLLANLMTCFRNREWEVVWYQCLAPQSRERWERERNGPEDFVEWCEASREDLMSFLNRASAGLYGSDVVQQQTGPNVTCLRMSPQVSSKFRVEALAFAHGTDGVRLLDVRWNSRADQSNRP